MKCSQSIDQNKKNEKVLMKYQFFQTSTSVCLNLIRNQINPQIRDQILFYIELCLKKVTREKMYICGIGQPECDS